jgi:hypothetical protein
VAHYVDGFVLPIPKDNLDDYLRIASEAAKVWPQPALVAGMPLRRAWQERHGSPPMNGRSASSLRTAQRALDRIQRVAREVDAGRLGAFASSGAGVYRARCGASVHSDPCRLTGLTRSTLD